MEIWASYIPYDSIGDLAGALVLVFKGGPDATVSWNEEPTEYDFHFLVREGDVVLSVRRYPGSGRGVKVGEEVLRAEGNASDICLPFWRALRRLESSMPPNEYKAAWGHRFPEKMKEIVALAAAFDAEDTDSA